MAAIVGAAELAPTLAAARAGQKGAAGQQGSAGHVRAASSWMPCNAERRHAAADRQRTQRDFPVLAAQFQSFARQPESACGVAKIIADRFRRTVPEPRTLETLHDVTPEEAIAHPNWVMGHEDLSRFRPP